MRQGFLVIFSLLLYLGLHADPDSKSQKEIDHLLDYIKKSNVTFIRNGDEHNAEEAAKHIQSKFERFKKKINSAEDFIEKCATKSELSGKPYEIKLTDGTKMETSKWLLAELKIFREKKPPEEKN